MNYYNEFDPFAASWLRNLIAEGLIPNGDVDERDMRTITPAEIRGYTQCHFFAGIGGWPLALHLAGWPSSRAVWTGSPPCQPFSSAGNQLGKDDERHLWPKFFDLISECRPPVLFGEQVATAIGHGWFDDLRTDLEAEGYAAGMVVLPACSVGAFHRRDRLFFVGDSEHEGLERHERSDYTIRQPGWVKTEEARSTSKAGVQFATCLDGRTRPIPLEPEVQPMVDGVSNRVGILRGAGNAIVPQVAAEVVKAYMGI